MTQKQQGESKKVETYEVNGVTYVPMDWVDANYILKPVSQGENIMAEWIDDYKKLIVARGIEISAHGILVIRDFIRQNFVPKGEVEKLRKEFDPETDVKELIDPLGVDGYNKAIDDILKL